MARKSLADLLRGVTVFGDYTVIGEGKKCHKNRYAKCLCKCGAVRDVDVAKLRTGRSTCCKDCAAKSSKRITNLKHGLSGSSEYGIYKGMVHRCTNPKSHIYEKYGAAGITVCERWLESFENFYEDMGPKPSPMHSIDRIDNTLGYSPENCRWALPVEQSANRSVTLKTIYKGKEVPVSQIAKKHGLSPATLAYRLQSGKSLDVALTTPKKNVKPKHNVNGVMMTASEIEEKFGVDRQRLNRRLRNGLTVDQAISLG